MSRSPEQVTCRRQSSCNDTKGMQRRLSVGVLNSHLLCVLCSGYLIDATAITECLHRFCRSCIITYLKDNKFCPICDVQIPDGKPSDYLRPDDIIQNLVYKMVPGLYQREMANRRSFYAERGIESPEGEAGGQLPAIARFFCQEDGISLSLEYYIEDENGNSQVANKNSSETNCKLYLKCPAAVAVRQLKKFLRMKFELDVDANIDIIYNEECLRDSFSLMDIAYTFKWDRDSPLRLAFLIYRKSAVKISHKPKQETTQLAVVPSKTTPSYDPRQQQRQSEYLGHLNLNPKSSAGANGPTDELPFGNTSSNTRLNDSIVDKEEESDSSKSGLRIVSEMETPDLSSEEEYHPKSLKKIGKRKRHDSVKRNHPEKRRKSDSYTEFFKKESLEEKKKRRKSLFEGERQSNDDGETLKNEALKKVFVYKEKPESSKKDDPLRRKKRKKSKHHEGDEKKRKLEALSSPSILSVAKDALKLKVKLTPLKIPKESDSIKEDDNKNREKEKDKIDKERLRHLRLVRHKTVVNKNDYVNTSPSLTISKVGLNEQTSGKTSLVESKPSLEIMLVNKKEECNGKPNESGALDLSEKAKVLDLSDKSTRAKAVSPVEKSPNKSTQQSILQIAETLVKRKLSPTPDMKSTDESVAVAAMRNLKTLSDTAVNILLAAQSQASQEIKPEEPKNPLKIPVYPRERTPIPPVPNLHEIYPRGRGRPLGGPPRAIPLIKPGQNLGVRQIPDPSVILNRQNNMLHQQNFTSRPDSSTSPGKPKLSAIPPLQSIKTKLPPPLLEKKDLPRPVNNLKMPVPPSLKPMNAVSSTSPMKLPPPVTGVRRLDMAKNIESVAAGLTARATALIDAK